MMTNTAPPIPNEVWQLIREFLAEGKTGSVTLDVKDGCVLAYKITEAGRVQEAPVRKESDGDPPERH